MYHPTALRVAILTSVFGCVLAQNTTTLAYDPTYDNPALSLNAVACSNGPNGLETRGYTTLGSLPNYPFIGGFSNVTAWNSPQCGSCLSVTYNPNNGTTINILAVDVSLVGFTVSEAAMNSLTGNQAVALGRVDVSYVLVPQSNCGL